MAQAPTGTQFKIRPWELGLELADYLATKGFGIHVRQATHGNTIFLGRMPAQPEQAMSVVPDTTPNAGALSRPHFTIYSRHLNIATGGAIAALVWEAFERQRPPLPSYDLFCECDDEGPLCQSNANNLPVHIVRISMAGTVRRA